MTVTYQYPTWSLSLPKRQSLQHAQCPVMFFYFFAGYIDASLQNQLRFAFILKQDT